MTCAPAAAIAMADPGGSQIPSGEAEWPSNPSFLGAQGFVDPAFSEQYGVPRFQISWTLSPRRTVPRDADVRNDTEPLKILVALGRYAADLQHRLL